MKLLYPIYRFFEVSWTEEKLFFIGVFAALMGYIILFVFPLRYFISFVNLQIINKSELKGNLYLPLAKKTLSRMNRFLPWTNKCIIKAAILKLLLNYLDIKSEVVLCVLKEKSNEIKAHAYIKLSNDIVFFRRKQYSDLYTIYS